MTSRIWVYMLVFAGIVGFVLGVLFLVPSITVRWPWIAYPYFIIFLNIVAAIVANRENINNLSTLAAVGNALAQRFGGSNPNATRNGNPEVLIKAGSL